MSFDEMFPTTRRSYTYLLKDYVYPTFGKLAVPAPTIQPMASASASPWLSPRVFPNPWSARSTSTYLDPNDIDPAAWTTDPDTLVVQDAGEDLYLLRVATNRWIPADHGLTDGPGT
jgi:hypothetical protein